MNGAIVLMIFMALLLPAGILAGTRSAVGFIDNNKIGAVLQEVGAMPIRFCIVDAHYQTGIITKDASIAVFKGLPQRFPLVKIHRFRRLLTRQSHLENL